MTPEKKLKDEPILSLDELSPVHRETVSATLRRNRKEQKQELKAVAQALRIRLVYLEAIEQGRYDALPGPTYALGFVKTYAEHLGLDEDEIVERFRSEVDGLEDQTQLVFPAPVPEGKVPGGAILMIALVMGTLAYGGWYYISNRDTGFADLIPALPERLHALFDGTPDDSRPLAEDSRQALVTAPGPAPEDVADQAEASAPTSADQASAAPASADPASTAPQDAVEQATGAETAGTTAGETANVTAAAPSAASGPATAEVPAAQTPAIAEATQAETESGETVTSASETAVPTGAAVTEAPALPAVSAPAEIPAAPTPTQTVAVPESTQPRIYGEDNLNARIVLRATQDAWVQVRDSSDELLLTRVLREGDVYRVPNQEGLTLLTGNAGGIDVVVDGTLMAPLGPVGSVRRDLPLDPQLLMSGQVPGSRP